MSWKIYSLNLLVINGDLVHFLKSWGIPNENTWKSIDFAFFSEA